MKSKKSDTKRAIRAKGAIKAKGAIITHPGCEDIAAKEVKELILDKAKELGHELDADVHLGDLMKQFCDLIAIEDNDI